MMTDISPSERRFQRTRQSILEAAHAILREQGIAALSMRALAEKVDYSPAALYKYFANKEELIAELRKQGNELSGAIQRKHLRPGMSTRETFRALTDAYLEFARTYPAYYELMMNSTEDIPGRIDDFLQEPGFHALIDFVAGVVQSGQVRLPPGYQPVHMALMMWFMANGAAMLQNTLMRNCQPEFLAISSKAFEMATELMISGPEQTSAGK